MRSKAEAEKFAEPSTTVSRSITITLWCSSTPGDIRTFAPISSSSRVLDPGCFAMPESSSTITRTPRLRARRTASVISSFVKEKAITAISLVARSISSTIARAVSSSGVKQFRIVVPPISTTGCGVG